MAYQQGYGHPQGGQPQGQAQMPPAQQQYGAYSAEQQYSQATAQPYGAPSQQPPMPAQHGYPQAQQPPMPAQHGYPQAQQAQYPDYEGGGSQYATQSQSHAMPQMPAAGGQYGQPHGAVPNGVGAGYQTQAMPMPGGTTAAAAAYNPEQAYTQPQQAYGQQPPQQAMTGAGYGGYPQGQQSAMPAQQQQPPQYGAQAGFTHRPVVPEGVQPMDERFVTLCAKAMPISDQVAQSSKLPLGIVIHPLADVGYELPVVNFGAVGVVRCKDCRAYINAYVQFVDNGQRWRCNMCGIHNDVPSNYFAPADENGRRQDVLERPELSNSSFEIMAPGEYMMRPPMPATFVWLVDVSLKSQQSGMLQTLCATILEQLDSLPGGERTQVAFITFDSTVHYYSLRADSTSVQMHVLSDLDDIFLPTPTDLLVNLHQCREQVEQLLEALPTMHRSRNPEVALGPAITAAATLMQGIGGKLMVCLSGLPSLGLGRLQNRENPSVLGKKQESTLLQPQIEYYKHWAVKMAQFQVCVDLFFFASEYMDVATISPISRFTGGQTYLYQAFNAAVSDEKFRGDLVRNLTRHTGWEAVLRVRCTAGVKLHSLYGNFILRCSDLLALPTVDCDKTFAAHISNQSTVLNTQTVSFQAALLYTTSDGQRRIRVHTTSIPVVSNVADLYAAANSTAICNLLTKHAVEKAIVESLPKARELITSHCVSIVRAHRAGTGQMLGENFNALPILTLGLLKNRTFKNAVNVYPDERAQLLNCVRTMGVTTLETFVRPRLLPIWPIADTVGIEEKGVVTLPQEAGLTAQFIVDENQAFLLDNGFDFFLRIGRSVSQEFLSELFGVHDNIETLDVGRLHLQQPDPANQTSLCARFHNILSYLRRLSPFTPQLIVMRAGDPSTEEHFRSMLIEDNTGKEKSLQEFANYLYQGGSY